jgi:hypothetical protein
MNRLAKIVEQLSYQELKEIQKDIYDGNISYLIKQKLSSIEKTGKGPASYCPVCSGEIKADLAKYQLVFGPEGLRKRASFCEIDCLEYFISELKELECKGW